MENNGITKAELLSWLDEVQQDARGILEYDSDDTTVRALREDFLERTERLDENPTPEERLEFYRGSAVVSADHLLYLIPRLIERLQRPETDWNVCALMYDIYQVGMWHGTLAFSRAACAPETMEACRSILGRCDGKRRKRPPAKNPEIDKFTEACRDRISNGGVIRNVRAFVDGVLDTLPELKEMTKNTKDPETKEVRKKARVGIRRLEDIVRGEIKPKHPSS